MKISVSLPKEVVESIENIVNQPGSLVKNRSSLIALALGEFLARNYPDFYLRSVKGRVVKPTVLYYLGTASGGRFRMRSPRLRGRRIYAEWVEIR